MFSMYLYFYALEESLSGWYYIVTLSYSKLHLFSSCLNISSAQTDHLKLFYKFWFKNRTLNRTNIYNTFNYYPFILHMLIFLFLIYVNHLFTLVQISAFYLNYFEVQIYNNLKKELKPDSECFDILSSFYYFFFFTTVINSLECGLHCYLFYVCSNQQWKLFCIF